MSRRIRPHYPRRILKSMNVDRLHTQIKQLLDAGVNVVLLGGTRHQIKQLADGRGTSIVDSFEIDEDIYAGEDFSSYAVHGISQSFLFSAQVYW